MMCRMRGPLLPEAGPPWAHPASGVQAAAQALAQPSHARRGSSLGSAGASGSIRGID